MNKYIGYRPTWAQINLENLTHNLRQIKRLISPETKIMACVKADAYGHGLIPVAQRLKSQGLDYLGVASIDEAILLRQVNIKLPILVLGIVLEEDIEPLFRYELIPTIATKEFAYALNKKAHAQNKIIEAHIKVDTGMGRIGVLPDDAYTLIKKVQQLKNIHIQGVFTHFAFADMNRKFTLYQLRLFNCLIRRIKSEGLNIPFIHMANSMGTIAYKESHFNMVRPGLVLYGLYPREGLKIKLKPVLSLRTKVVYVKRLPAGFGISYGHTYVTKKPSTIVTLPIGYGDGYPRNLSNKGPVLIQGKRFKISGRVCMDQMMVDVGDCKVKVGDEAVLIGTQGKEKISVQDLAVLADTIAYEIVCGLGSRIPRVYT
jgi:alanine racemase